MSVFVCLSIPLSLSPLNQFAGQRYVETCILVVWKCHSTSFLPFFQVILSELYSTGFQRSFSDEDDLTAIADSDVVYAFQAPPLYSRGGSTTSHSGNQLSQCDTVFVLSVNWTSTQFSCLPFYAVSGAFCLVKCILLLMPGDSACSVLCILPFLFLYAWQTAPKQIKLRVIHEFHILALSHPQRRLL